MAQAYRNVGQAMTNAGYSPASYKIVVQDYPSPLPNGAGIRYPEKGYTRYSVGGCGFWNRDADWANATAVSTVNATVAGALADSGLPDAVMMHLFSAFGGRRRCEQGVGLLEEEGLSSWSPCTPNYWGQLAMRDCLRSPAVPVSRLWDTGTVVAPGSAARRLRSRP